MIAFRNPGNFDFNALRLFGASVKVGDNPIGMFGTGLKYALAVLLRHGATVRIQTDPTALAQLGTPGHVGMVATRVETIRLDKGSVRGTDFDVVHLGKEPLGFTTELGKGWELWQAYRELYCNALDEGGEAFAVSASQPLQFLPSARESGGTLITVEGLPDFDTVHAERSHYFIEDRQLLYSTGAVEVYAGSSSRMFYRGVAVRKLSSPSICTWNILSRQELTEDRTLKYEYMADKLIGEAVMADMPSDLVEKLLLAQRATYEGRLDYTFLISRKTSEATREVLARLHLSPHLNQSAYRKFRAERTADEGYQAVKLSRVEGKQLARALKVLSKAGWPITETVVVTADLPDSTLGTTHKGGIVINRRTFGMGTKMVAGTIFEEYLHINRGVQDETREMQNHLIDLVMTMVENHVMLEPI